MNIGTHLVNNYDSNVQSNARVEQNKNKATVDSTRTKLSELKEGSVFKGEIVDMNGQKATISMENQEMLQARMKEGVELNVGDILLFNVEENNSSQVLIKPLFDSLYSAETQTLEKILDGAGLSPTEKNFTAAKELMDAGMPVDKASLVKVLSQSMKFPDAPISTLVALNKMNIPVNEANIAQYERYQNLNHALMGDISDTASVMSDFANQLPANMDGGEMLSFAKEVIAMFSEDAAIAEYGLNNEQDMEALVQTNQDGVPETNNSNDINNQNITLTQGMDQEGKMAEADANVLKDTANTVSKDEQLATVPQQDNQNVSNNQSINHSMTTELPADNQLLTNVESNDMQLQQQVADKMQDMSLSNEEAQQLMKNVGSEADTLSQMAKSNSATDMLKTITDAMSNGKLDSETTKQILSSDGFKKLFEQMIKENWALDPEQMKSPKEIDDLYQKIAKQSQSFEQMLSAKGGDSQQFQQGSQNMRQNMSFMEQMNQQMIYAQMPLKLSNQQANSELFVYADKRRLVEKRDGISVMLHLDMDHLGMTDVKVTLTGKNVNARFYFNDQQSVDIVVENMEQLEKQLMDRGFTLTNEVVKRKPADSVNQVVNEIIDENAEKSVKRYTFDVKM